MIQVVDVHRAALDAQYQRYLAEAGAISAVVFHGHVGAEGAEQSLAALARAHPLYYLYVAVERVGEGGSATYPVVGYILWRIEGGPDRERMVVELDQLAVHPQHHGRGIGKQLTADSRAKLGGELAWWREERRRSYPDLKPLTGIRWVVWFYEANGAARKLYGQLFRSEGGKRDYYGKPELMLYEDVSAPESIEA